MMNNLKNYIPFGLLVLFAVLSFLIIKPFLQAVFLGTLLAYVCYPLHNMIKKRMENRTIPALIVCLVMILIIFVPLIFLVNVLIKEATVLFIVVKQKLAVGIFKGCENNFCQALEQFSNSPEIKYQIQEISKTITNWIIQRGSDFLLSVPRIILNLVVVFFVMFYSLKDGRKVLENIKSFNIRKYDHLIIRIKEVIQGVVYGYLLVALIQGAFGALGFFIFGVSSPLFWGLVMAFMALVPMLGTGIIWAPAAVIIFLDGIFQDSTSMMLKGIGLFVYSFIFVASSDNFLRPKMMGNKAKIHPAIILLGIFGGMLIFGPLGVIIGPLILAFMAILVKAYMELKEEQINDKSLQQ